VTRWLLSVIAKKTQKNHGTQALDATAARFSFMPRGIARMPGQAAAAVAIVSVMMAASGVSGAATTAREPASALRVPPPPLEERMPSPPGRGAFTWQPGSWRWSGFAGVEWQWEPGHYVAWSADRATWDLDRILSPPTGSMSSDDAAR
jgi:hypothetical protein